MFDISTFKAKTEQDLLDFALHEAIKLTDNKVGYVFLYDEHKRVLVLTTRSGHMVNRKKDGSLFHEEATISPVADASGKITNFVAVNRDITEHVELSKQMFQAQKMEAVGTLAGVLPTISIISCR